MAPSRFFCRPTVGSKNSGLGLRTCRSGRFAGASVDAPVIEFRRMTEDPLSAPGAQTQRLVVRVIGDVDADTAPLLFAELVRAIEAVPAVCCDLSATAYFGADGANVLAVAHLHAAKMRASFAVRGVHGMVAQVLKITGLTEILSIGG